MEIRGKAMHNTQKDTRKLCKVEKEMKNPGED